MQPSGWASAGHTQGMLDLVAQIADLIIVKHDALLGQFAAIMLQAVGKGKAKEGKQTDAQKKWTRTTCHAPPRNQCRSSQTHSSHADGVSFKILHHTHNGESRCAAARPPSSH
jgi:hypothetical protein